MEHMNNDNWELVQWILLIGGVSVVAYIIYQLLSNDNPPTNSPLHPPEDDEIEPKFKARLHREIAYHRDRLYRYYLYRIAVSKTECVGLIEFLENKIEGGILRDKHVLDFEDIAKNDGDWMYLSKVISSWCKDNGIPIESEDNITSLIRETIDIEEESKATEDVEKYLKQMLEIKSNA